MADPILKTLPELTAAGAVSDSDLLPIYQGVSPLKKAVASVLRTYFSGGLLGILSTSGNNIIGDFEPGAGMYLGSATGASRLVIKTDAAEIVRGLDIFHAADQTAPSNQYPAFTVHNYTDGVSSYIDTVGDKTSLVLRQARNAAARPDKPSTYIGSGPFWQAQRTRITGGGNLGSGNDLLCGVDENGSLVFYGTGAPGSPPADWAGLSTNAPIRIGTYTGFLTKTLYMGYDYANDKAIIGAIDTGTSTFKPVSIAASALNPIGDNAVSLGAVSLRYTYVQAFFVRTHSVAVSALPSAASNEGTRAFVNDSNAAASGNFGAIVAAGGSNKVPVYSDGTDWRIG